MHLPRTEKANRSNNVVVSTRGFKTFVSEKEVWIICRIPYQLIIKKSGQLSII